MTRLLPFAEKHHERTRSLLALYVIHSLAKGKKSGYDILKELRELTQGSWVPSKGALYPLLHQLEEDGQIVSVTETTGARSRAVFCLTPSGRETFRRIRAHGSEHHQKMAKYRHVLSAVFGNILRPEMNLLFEMKMLLEEMPEGKKAEAEEVLRRCLDELRRVI
jgi:DNA-binding PadR family transcriptional regulator